MKIAFLNIYSGINNRGAETFIHELSQRLAEKHDVTIFSAGEVSLGNVKNVVINEKVYQPQQGFFSNHLQNILKRLFLDWGSLSSLFFTLKIIPELKKGDYDVIIPVNGFWQVLICKILQIRLKFRILITGHSGPGWDERWNLFLGPDIFVATTEPTNVWAKKTAFWISSETIPYGIDTNEFKVEPEKVNLEKPIFLCPAAAVPYKRVDLAIKAVANLPKGSLLHLGDGPLSQEIAKLGKDLLSDKRFLSKSVTRGDIAKYYAASDIVVLPSMPQENSPMVFLEALAAGKPVVATGTDRNRWLLGEAGIYVDPENLTLFTEALLAGTKLSGSEKISDQVKKYSWANVLSQYEVVLNELMKGRNGGIND